MKVLVLAELDKWNSFKQSLKKILDLQGMDTEFSLSKFWTSEEDYDLVFFHWEEYLAKGYQTDQSFLAKLEQRLQHWKSKSKLVLLKHNLKVHTALENAEKIFELVNKYQDGIIHMGDYSQQEYLKMYDFGGCMKHTIIPHQWYIDVPNEIERSVARKKLEIDDQKFVVLVFGAIRKQTESDLILKAFNLLDAENKLLLVSSWRGESSVNKRSQPFKWLRLKIQTLFQNLNPKLKLNQSFVDETEVQHYFNAADMLFLPRVDSLNSGNIPLAFTFGKVVVGANIGNMGEILRNTENPVFDANSDQSIKKAMNTGYELARSGKGEENYNFASESWNYERVGKAYKRFFEEVIERESVQQNKTRENE